MWEEIKDIKSSKKDLRDFGITVGSGFFVLGGLFWWRTGDFYPLLFIIAALLVFLGISLPGILKPFQKVWMSLAVVLGWLMTRLILIILFFLVITPISLLMKSLGKDILDIKFDRTARSYWVPVTNSNPDRKTYENQF